MKKVVFFDGYCSLCNGFVNVLFQLDRQKSLYFSSLQGETFKSLDEKGIIDKEILNVDSVIYYKNDKFYIYSDAVLEILVDLGGIYKLFDIFKIIPARLRNKIYQYIAKNRSVWFNTRSTCRLPSESEKTRFLP